VGENKNTGTIIDKNSASFRTGWAGRARELIFFGEPFAIPELKA